MKGSTKYQLLKSDYEHAKAEISLKNKLIKELREEVKQCGYKLQYEEYLTDEANNYSDYLVGLLDKTFRHLDKDTPLYLLDEIANVIKANSV
ncbi:hypothetical protein P4V41_07975 [Fictibacillus nanhaiensis]|uniref:hypothetical protein n=1 Tax=Fictibacillus nanhaiensis TaxID=742169 RepID=UPI002E24BB98|nr:hypothetical protein [Fictibacillus nanhaiensis]